ncbi:uncharacterized protein LOC144915129 [Branchiostoma floridae x Branchiostoma belcheri]
MKFIPQKYRESQMDRFGKRELSWHIAVAQRYCNGVFETKTFVQIFDTKTESGISIERIDFSDPQGGKGPCDRKAATVKSNMRIYLNEGLDVTIASQMKKAITATSVVAVSINKLVRVV